MADLSKLTPGLEGQVSAKVEPARMAPAVGSGHAPVFASPSMVALMEGASVAAIEHLLPGGHQSLGTHLDIQHIAATPEGLTVTATARLTDISGRKLTFAVEAHDGIEIIGRGSHTRVVVDTPRFMSRLESKGRSRSS